MKHNLKIQTKTTHEFAELPAGESYHNPNAILPNEIPAGFRILTKRELDNDFEGHPILRWDGDHQAFVDTTYRFSSLWASSCIIADTVPLVIEPDFEITNYIAGDFSGTKFMVIADKYIEASLTLTTPITVYSENYISRGNSYGSFDTIGKLLSNKGVELKSFKSAREMFAWLAE